MNVHIQIGDISPRIQYTGDGSQTVFTYPFPIFVEADIEVYENATLKTITTDYTVQNAGQSAGGTVTFLAAPANSVVVTLRRNIAISRTSDFQESGAFRAKVINDELDLMTAGLQQVEDEVNRSLRQSTTDASGNMVLPDQAARKGKVLSFDAATGDPVVSTKTLADMETEATAAAASAAAAAISETNAASSETNAASSETNAATSAVTAAAAASAGLYADVVDKSANYTVLEADSGDLIRVDTSGGTVTITLPDVTALSNDFRVAVVKITGDANTVTVARAGTNTINGGTSKVLQTQYDIHNFVGDKETGQYVAVTNAANPIESFLLAVSDEITAITTGTAKLTWRMPKAFTLTEVRASLNTASSSGVVAVDINEGGTSILSTKLTIDANEKTSTTAAAAAVISDADLADDAEITIDIDTAGTEADGLKVALLGRPA